MLHSRGAEDAEGTEGLQDEQVTTDSDEDSDSDEEEGMEYRGQQMAMAIEDPAQAVTDEEHVFLNQDTMTAFTDYQETAQDPADDADIVDDVID